MRQKINVKPHRDPWVNLPGPYIESLVTTLTGQGFEIPRAWMDPMNPRDATIQFSRPGQPLQALVWDEQTGVRVGRFVTGEQGIRTELAECVHLGGGLLPDAKDVIRRLELGVVEPQTVYRSYTDVRDGLDDHLRGLR